MVEGVTMSLVLTILVMTNPKLACRMGKNSNVGLTIPPQQHISCIERTSRRSSCSRQHLADHPDLPKALSQDVKNAQDGFKGERVKFLKAITERRAEVLSRAMISIFKEHAIKAGANSIKNSQDALVMHRLSAK